MRLLRYRAEGSIFIGNLGKDDMVVPLSRVAGNGQDEILHLAMMAKSGVSLQPIGDPVARADVEVLVPIPKPPSVRDFLTFERHFEIMLRDADGNLPQAWYDFPGFYFTSPHDLFGEGGKVHPPAASKLDYELEVAVIIGKDGRNLTPETAVDHIAGYALFNDYSARDIQAHEMSIGLGPSKCKDFGGALGPVLVTPDEIGGTPGQPDGLLRASVNGRPYSEGELSEMRYSFAEMIAHASTNSWVRAGDVLGSGTCPTGCIAELSKVSGEEAYPWLVEGDVVALSHEVLGTLTTQVGGVQ